MHSRRARGCRAGGRWRRVCVCRLGKLGWPGEAAESAVHPFGSEGSWGGVGLAVAQRTVSILGGTLYVDDRYGEGTTFTVRLPWRPVVLVDLGEASPPPPAPSRGEAVAQVSVTRWV